MFQKGKFQVLRSLIKRSDMYSHQVSLNYRKQTGFQTFFGGASTLFTIIIILTLTLQAAITLFKRHNSTTQVQTLHSFDPEEKNFTSLQFQIHLRLSSGWRWQDENGRKFFNYSIKQVQIKNGVVEEYDIEMDKCDIRQFRNINGLNFVEQFEQLNKNNSICLSPKTNISLQGNLFAQASKRLQISLNPCTDYSKCYSLNEIRKQWKKNKINSLNINIGFTNSYLLQEGSKLQPVLTEYDFPIHLQGQQTKGLIAVSQNLFREDISILPRVAEIQYSEFLNSILMEKYVLQQNNYRQDTFVSIMIIPDQSYKSIYKTYDKFDSYLAYVGGIIQIITFFLGYFVTRYNKYAFYISLANKLYTFDLQTNKFDREQIGAQINNNSPLSMNQIRTRLRARIKQIRSKINQARTGENNLMKENQILQILMSKGKISVSNSIVKKSQSNSRQDLGRNEEYSINYMIGTEPHAQEFPMQKKTQMMDLLQSFPSAPILQTNNNQRNRSQMRTSIHKSRIQSKYHISGLICADSISECEDSIQEPNQEDNMIDFSSKRTFLEQSFQDILKYTKKIAMSGQYMISKLFCRKILFRRQHTIQLIDKAIQMLKEDTDLVKILEKLQDIDKLKKIILNEDQIMVFNYTPKPIVKAQLSSRRSFLQFDKDALKSPQLDLTKRNPTIMKALLQSKRQFKSSKSFFKLYKAYNRLFYSNTINKQESQVNWKLMMLIGQELREIFEVSQYLNDSPQAVTNGNEIEDKLDDYSMRSNMGSLFVSKTKPTDIRKQLSSFGRLRDSK